MANFQPIRIAVLNNLLAQLLPRSFQELIAALTEFLRLINGAIGHFQKPRVLYEVLSYQASVELLDSRGRTAVYKRRQEIRFLQDCASGFYDYGWGDGQSYATHQVQPGRILDRQSLGSRFRSLIALPTAKQKGETFAFTVQRRIQQGFLKPEQLWLEVDVIHTTEKLSLAVIFPAVRTARQAWVVEQQSQQRIPLQVGRRLADGRSQVRYFVQEPKLGARYTLEWRW